MDRSELTPEELALLTPDASDDATATGVDGEFDGAEWAHGADPASLRRQLEVLETFHHDVASRFADRLSRSLQRLVEVRLTQVESITYSQFAFSRANPTCFVVLKATPLPTPLALDLSPSILFPILDVLLGGGHHPCTPPDRAPTELEQRLASTVACGLLDELHDAWEPLLALDLSVDRIETDARRVRLVAPGEAITTLVFHAEVAEQSGELTFCLPCRAIRKIVDKLLVGEYHQGTDGSVPSTPDAVDALAEIVVQIDSQPLSCVELQNLRVGDVILSDVNVDGPVSLMLHDKPFGKGRLGSVGDHRAVEIVRPDG